MHAQSRTNSKLAAIPTTAVARKSHHSGDDVSREQQAAVRFLAAVEAAGLKNDSDMLVPALAAAGLIGVKQQTLALWRCERRHNLPYIKNGRRIHYRLGELRRFIAKQELNIPAIRV